MFGKLATLIACIAACGGWLLSLRHERVQALSELTQAQLRINRQDERLWMLRTQVAERTTPPRIQELAAGIVDLKPIIPSDVFTPDQLRMMASGTGTGPVLIGPPLPPGMVEGTQVALGSGPDGKAARTGTADAKGTAPRAVASKGTKGTPSKASAAKTDGRRQAKAATPSKPTKSPTRVAKGDRNGEEN